MLIYLKTERQADVFRKLHAVLASGGFLALGKTEKLPIGFEGLFRETNLTVRSYQKA